MWTWIRAPSIFHSKSASAPNAASASAASAAVCASIGATGANTCRLNDSRPGAPRVSAACASGPSPPASIAARRTSSNRQCRGSRDRIDHHALERALAQIADDQSQQEILLRLGRLGEQFAQDAGALGTGSGAALTGDAREVRIDRLQRQRRGRGGRHVGGGCQAAMTEADLSLRQGAGEPVDGDFDFFGGERLQECGQRGDLRQPAAAAGDQA